MNIKYNLKELGWNEVLGKEFEPFKDNYIIGRVAVEYKNLYRVYVEEGEVLASVSGKMMHEALGREDYPAVGDWVCLSPFTGTADKSIIHSVLKRKSKFSRKIAGDTFEEQIVATNIDTVFLCMSLNQNFNLRRMERYVTMAWNSGANPVILLTKADLCEDIEEKVEAVQESAPGVEVHSVSVFEGRGIPAVQQYIKEGTTVAFIGPSGVGKSTMINALLGEERQETQNISETGDRGRHTTTRRELLLLPNRGLIIDTPGMKELHLLDVEESLENTFEDIEKLALQCKFSDCSHTSEPKCAVRNAIELGLLEERRYANYIKLKKEAAYFERKVDQKAKMAHKKSIKKLMQSVSKKR